MTTKLNHPYSKQATVIRLDEQSAVLQLPDGQSINWPLDLLPPDTKVNDSLKIIIHNKKTDEEERQRLARTLLNEVMIESETS